MKIKSYSLVVESQSSFQMMDLTSQIRDFLALSNIQQGMLSVISQHTTTAISINEMESRLMEDVKQFFSKLVPAKQKYKHNDIHLRECPPDEPENAHSHIVAMLLSQSQTVPIVDGELSMGQWQSVILFELDGPRQRNIRLQFMGD